VDGNAAGIAEAKKQGATLTGVDVQSARYAQGPPEGHPTSLCAAYAGSVARRAPTH
jgi:hypothetical protein